MDGDGSINSNGTDHGIEGKHRCAAAGTEREHVAVMNDFVEGISSIPPMAIVDEGMQDSQQLMGLEDYKTDTSLNNDGIGSPALSPQNSANYNATLSDFSSTNPVSPGVNIQRASDLLIVVSMCAEPTRTKIIDLAYSAMDELSKIGVAGKQLWQPQKEGRYETLNDIEYLRECGQVDDTLREFVKMVEVGEPQHLPSFDSYGIDEFPKPRETPKETLQIEASRDMTYVKTDPISLVELLMDLNQWSSAFHNIVTRATILGILSEGVEGSYDEKLQVMNAELHLPTLFVPTRECYFARYCKQLSNEMWGVVDVSLEKFLPSPSNNFRRRPSGCLITAMPIGYSKVVWVEHVEADHSQLSIHFQALVASGFAFGATRWLAAMARHIECSEALKARTNAADDEVLITQSGRASILKLAKRMMRSFCSDISASTTNTWMQLPSFPGSEVVGVMIKNNMKDTGKPLGTTVVFTTSLRIAASPSRLFNFLRDENSRNKWDLLSRGLYVRESAYIIKGRDPRNRVSVMEVNAPQGGIEIFYLQESYADSTGSYVIYAPIDEFAMSALLKGGNPDRVAILPSGFAVLPDGLPADDRTGDSGIGTGTGSLLTVAFHIVANRPVLAQESIDTIRRIITDTVAAIMAEVLHA